jgi:hypothetical protein
MMRDIDCGKHARARLWVGELPDIRSQCGLPIAQSFPAKPMSRALSRSVALEMMWPTGPRWLYGLLGATYTPGHASALDVTICTDEIPGEAFQDALAFSRNDVRMGLLPEYGPAVSAGLARRPGELQALGAGTLDFNCAAHSEIGSAVAVFRTLASTVLSVLATNQPVADDQIVHLLRSQLFSQEP